MFTSVEETKKLTGYDVSLDELYRAQSILESYIGKVEAEIEAPNDLSILGKATAYQAAYMHDNYDRIFEQMAVTRIAQSDGGVAPDTAMIAPFIAPLAVLATRSLSWKRSRAVRTGSMFGRVLHIDRWETK